MPHHSWLILLMPLVFADTAAGQAQTRTRTTSPFPMVSKSVAWITNVPYVTGAGPERQLDLYIPTNRQGEPLVVYVHGGGWAAGDKAGDSINPNNLQWLWQGYAIASINYRLVGTALWPAQIEDCKAAIRWLKAHAREYGYSANFGLNINPKTGNYDAGEGGIGLFEDPAVEPMIIKFLRTHLH